MPILLGLFFGILAGLVVPFAVRDHPDTFNGLLAGGMLWVPVLEKSVHWSWPVFGVVAVLIWGLLKVARS